MRASGLTPRRAGVLALAALLGACDPPAPQPTAASSAPSPAPAPAQERWVEVTSEIAPLLYLPPGGTDEPVPGALRRGDLVILGEDDRAAPWNGVVEGASIQRQGMVVHARRAPSSGQGFVYRSDLGAEVKVSPAASLCDAVAKRGPFETSGCMKGLHRSRAADGAIVSYLLCETGPCPVAIERGDKLGVIAVQNLRVARFFTGEKASVLVGQTYFVKAEGKRKTGSIVVITLSGDEPARAAEHVVSDEDATSTDRVVSRDVTVKVTRAEIRLTGKVEERDGAGKVLSSKPVDETYPLPPLD